MVVSSVSGSSRRRRLADTKRTRVHCSNMRASVANKSLTHQPCDKPVCGWRSDDNGRRSSRWRGCGCGCWQAGRELSEPLNRLDRRRPDSECILHVLLERTSSSSTITRVCAYAHRQTQYMFVCKQQSGYGKRLCKFMPPVVCLCHQAAESELLCLVASRLQARVLLMTSDTQMCSLVAHRIVSHTHTHSICQAYEHGDDKNQRRW